MIVGRGYPDRIYRDPVFWDNYDDKFRSPRTKGEADTQRNFFIGATLSSPRIAVHVDMTPEDLYEFDQRGVDEASLDLLQIDPTEVMNSHLAVEVRLN